VDRLSDAAWRARAAPFDGLTVCTSDELPTASLLAGAARVADLLRHTFPEASIHSAEDWLEHDGFVNEPQHATWSDLLAAVETEAAFVEASPWDTYVRRAWLGESSFYFRWHYYDEGDSPFAADPPAGGDLDVTADAEFAAVVVRELAVLGIETNTETATTFFNKRYNG
jgi:hypothetical protein